MMRSSIRLAAAAFACVLSVPAMTSAQAAESVVILEGGVVGTLNQPDNATGAAVLMLHGFGSYRDEVGDMYKNAAAAMAEKGITSLRVDFRGFGKSDGDTGSTTVDLQVADAKVADAYLKAVDGVDAARVGVLGFSLGGGIAIDTTATDPTAFKSMVTWSSVGDYSKDFLGVLGQKAFDRAKEDGVVGLDLGWRTIVLKQSFFDSLAAHSLADAIATYPGALLMIAGSEDFSAAYPERFIGLAKGGSKEAWIVPGGDHIYQVLSGNPAMSDGVIAKTAEWFATTL